MKTYRIVICSFLLSLGSVYAATNQYDEVMSQALQQFQKGGYSQTIDLLKKLKSADKNRVETLYWIGMSEYKLQQFESAKKHLKTAVKKDKSKQFEDAAYHLGQSCYALQEFKDARGAFEQSVDQGYKVAQSLYYIGYICNMLDQDEKALETFNKILKLDPKDADQMRQSAWFQMAEIYTEKAQKTEDAVKQKNIYKTKAIPLYESAIQEDSESPLSKQAQMRIDEIKPKIGEEVARTASGAAVPQKPWMLRFSQDFKYDTNIVNQADGRLNQVSFTDSHLSKTAIFGKYEAIFKNWIAVTPEVTTDLTYHGRRGHASVYSNDASSIVPAIRTRLDHKINDKTAAGIAEYEFSYGTRDIRSNKHLFTYYNRHSNFILGERYTLRPGVSTTLKLNLKFAENQNRLQNYVAKGINLNQSVPSVKDHLLNVSLTFEGQKAKSQFYDYRIYRANLTYSMPQLYWKTNTDLGFNFTGTDTMHQYDARGFERTFNPTITFTKTVDKSGQINVNLNYGYTRNLSRDLSSYQYKKHVVGLGVQFTL